MVALVRCSASHSGPVDPADLVRAVVLVLAVAEVAVERAAFVAQVLALRPQRVRHTIPCQ